MAENKQTTRNYSSDSDLESFLELTRSVLNQVYKYSDYRLGISMYIGYEDGTEFGYDDDAWTLYGDYKRDGIAFGYVTSDNGYSEYIAD